MNKENCTKGPVKISPHCPTNVCNEAEDRHIAATGHAARTPQTDEDKANADLIAEAFNVLNETGMTPRELANALSYLSGKVGSLADTMPDEDDKRSDDEVLNDLATCRHIIDDIQAKLETFNTL